GRNPDRFQIPTLTLYDHKKPEVMVRAVPLIGLTDGNREPIAATIYLFNRYGHYRWTGENVCGISSPLLKSGRRGRCIHRTALNSISPAAVIRRRKRVRTWRKSSRSRWKRRRNWPRIPESSIYLNCLNSHTVKHTAPIV